MSLRATVTQQDFTALMADFEKKAGEMQGFLSTLPNHVAHEHYPLVAALKKNLEACFHRKEAAHHIYYACGDTYTADWALRGAHDDIDCAVEEILDRLKDEKDRYLDGE